GADELTAVAVLQRLQQQTTSQAGFAPSGFTDQHDVFRLGDELQFGKGAHLFAVDARLVGEGESFQGPALRQVGAPDAPLQGALLSGVPLRAHQTGEELRVSDIFLFGGAELFVVNLQNAPELEVFQELFEFFSHRSLYRP